MQARKIDHQGNAWDYGHEFHVGNTVAGGLALRYQPGQSSPGALDWEKTVGVPEALDEAMAFIGGSSTYGDWETTYSPDIPLNHDANGLIIPDENGKRVLENEVTHYFFVNGTDVYDLWLYINRCSRNIQEKLLKSAYKVLDICLKIKATGEAGGLDLYSPLEGKIQIRECPHNIGQKRVKEKHNDQGSAAGNIEIPGPLRGEDGREELEKQFSSKPAKNAAQSVGHQVVYICRPIGEDLKKLNQKGEQKAKQRGPVKFLIAAKQHRKKKAQGHEQQDIQQIVP